MKALEFAAVIKFGHPLLFSVLDNASSASINRIIMLVFVARSVPVLVA